MTADRRLSFYAITLLLGSLAMTFAGLRHPHLVGDGPEQLALIAATARWRMIHGALAVGIVLAVTGLAGVMGRHAGTPGERAARVGSLAAAFGYVVLLVAVLFMQSSATALAHTYAEGSPGLAATHAAFTYDMLHPFALSAIRTGALGISLGLYVLGWAAATGGVLPRWLGFAGVAGGIVGVIGAAVGGDGSPLTVLGVAAATGWQVAAGAYSLKS